MVTNPSTRHLDVPGFEDVVSHFDPASGLSAVVAIHSTALGPALGGTRWLPYDTEEAALADVTRLARGMSYKAALAGLDLGGGKAVVLGDLRAKTPERLLAYGRLVDSLGGRYVTAADVNTAEADMDVVRRATSHVTGVSPALGGLGDLSGATALGVLAAAKGVVSWMRGDASLAGLHVVVSGVGKVGTGLARLLVAEGARVTVADVAPERTSALVRELGCDVVAPEEAHRIGCDVFSPCALGGVLSATSIPELGCEAVVGAANNQLAEPAADAERLAARGVVYAPDYAANAGGLVCADAERRGLSRAAMVADVRAIGRTVADVLARAEKEGVTPARAADDLAEERLALARV